MPLFKWVMFWSISFLIFIMLFYISLHLVFYKRIKGEKKINWKFEPNITILVPAYNAGKSIGKTLESILDSDYPKNKSKVIVIDDGSKDNTVEIIKKYPVKLIRLKKNVGKANALNKALKNIKTDYFITIDSDTVLEKTAIRKLITMFDDPKVGAVSGAYKSKPIGNRKSILRRVIDSLQSIEYLLFVSLRKRQEALNCIRVVPGSIGAYKTKAVIKAGGYDPDNLIEDYELTLKIHKAGYKIASRKDALAWTKTRSLNGLIKQRTRWYRGGIQCLQKHSDMLSLDYAMLGFLMTIDVFVMLLQLIIFSLIFIKTITISFPRLVQAFFTTSDYTIFTFDMLFLLSLVTSVLGLLDVYLSIKLVGESKKKLFMYPIMFFYAILLSFIWLVSAFKEIYKVERKW